MTNDLSQTAVDYSGEPLWPAPATVTVTCPCCSNVFTSRLEPHACPACGREIVTVTDSATNAGPCCSSACCCEGHDPEGGCRQ